MLDNERNLRIGQKAPAATPGVQVVTSISLPAEGFHGQVVYVYDLDEFRVYDGINGEWMHPASGGGGGGSGNSTKVSPTPPVADQEGDTWLNTTNATLYVWVIDDGGVGAWVQVVDPQAQQAQTDAAVAYAAAMAALGAPADGDMTTYYSTTDPSLSGPVEEYDAWVKTDTNQVYRWLGDAWILIQGTVADSLIAAQTALNAVDGKVSVYYDTYPNAVSVIGPTLGTDNAGDLLYATDQSNRMYRWSGSAWTALLLGNEAVTEDAMDYKTITGALIRTGAPPEGRVEIYDYGPSGQITFYSGQAGEQLPGRLTVSGQTDYSMVELVGPKMSSAAPPTLQMQHWPTSNYSQVSLTASRINLAVGQSGFVNIQGYNTMVNGSEGGLVPVGAIIMWTNNNIPANWQICDGRSFSSTVYPKLYDALGSTVLPDMRMRIPIGADTSGVYSSVLWVTNSDGRPLSLRSDSHSHYHVHKIGGTLVNGTIGQGGVHSHSASTGNPDNTVQVAVGSDRTPGSGTHGHNVNVTSSSSHSHSFTGTINGIAETNFGNNELGIKEQSTSAHSWLCVNYIIHVGIPYVA